MSEKLHFSQVLKTIHPPRSLLLIAIFIIIGLFWTVPILYHRQLLAPSLTFHLQNVQASVGPDIFQQYRSSAYLMCAALIFYG